MGFNSSHWFALLLFTAVVYAQQPSFTPGPTRTPNADHQSDQEHHELLRRHDRELHAWYRSNLAADAAAANGAAESAAEDARAEDRELAEARRKCLGDYQALLRAWDQDRLLSYREGTQFTTPRPSEPNCDDPYATTLLSASIGPVASPSTGATTSTSLAPLASPSAGAPTIASPMPTASLTPHEYDKLLQEQIRVCDRAYHADLRAWLGRKAIADQNGQVFTEVKPTQPDCEEVAEEAVAAMLGTNPSPVARILAW